MNTKPMARPVAKESESRLVVYDMSGRRLGTVDPQDLEAFPSIPQGTNLGTPKDDPMPSAARPVLKGAKKAQMAVFDANGNLVGTCDPDEVTMLAQAKAPDAKPKAAAAAPATAPAAAPVDPKAELTKKAMALRKGMEQASSVAEREQIATVLNQAAIVKLATIRMQAARGR